MLKLKIVLLLVSCLLSSSLLAQSTYSYNLEGYDCYTRFTKFAPNDSYSKKKPTIVVWGEPGLDSEEVFAKDELKSISDFFGYLFIYVPSLAVPIDERLSCLEVLMASTTNQYEYGTENLFLQINDDRIKPSDLEKSSLINRFSTINYSSKDITTMEGDTITEQDNIEESSNAASLSDNEISELISAFQEVPLAELKERSRLKQRYEYYDGPAETFDFTLSGIVQDGVTGESLPFANVTIQTNGRGVATNMDGYFTLNNVPSDTSTILVNYIGYGTIEAKLTPSIPKSNFIIEAIPVGIQLDAVLVKGSREELVRYNDLGISTIKMTPKKLEQLPNIGEKDIMRAFQLNPGVSASNESSSGMYVRGGTPDQNLITYDGFTIYHVDHLYGFFSAFNANALKDVQLYKGGFESKFGGRLSSVTEIIGKEGNANTFNIGGNLSLLSYGLFAEIPSGEKFTSIVAFRKSYRGFIYNTIFDQFNDEEDTSGPAAGRFSSQQTTASSFFYDLNGKFTYRPSEKDIISLSVFNGTDDLDNGFSFETPPFLANQGIELDFNVTDVTQYGNFATGLKWSRKWNHKLYSNTTVSYSNYFSDRDFIRSGSIISDSETNSINSGTFESNDLKDFSFKSDITYDLWGKVTLEGGVFGTSFDIDYSYAETDAEPLLDRKDNGAIVGTYLQSEQKLLNERLEISPGLRSSYFDGTDKYYLEPRMSASLMITDKLSLKSAYGKYYQFANRVLREDISAGSRDFWILSDGDQVPVSSAVHYIGGLSYDIKDYYFSAEIYFKDLENITEYSLRFDPGNRPGAVSSYDQNFFNGLGYSKGLEILAQRKYGKYTGWLSYTLSETQSQFDVYGDEYFSANQDVTHEFKAVGLMKHRRWNFSATWIYSTGRPYTAPSGAYDVEFLDGSSQEYFTVTSKNSLRLPDYHRLDLSANYKLLRRTAELFDDSSDVEEVGSIGLSFFNLYGRTNTWYNQYEILEGEIIETNVNYLGFMPNLSISWRLR